MVLIGRAADLDSLISSRNGLRPSRRPSVRIRVSQLSNSETLEWEQKFESFREACGCSHAAVAMGLFAVVFVACAFRSELFLPGRLARPAMMWTGAIFFLGLIVSTILGKVFGLWIADRGYRKTCLELKFRLERMVLPNQKEPRTPPTNGKPLSRHLVC